MTIDQDLSRILGVVAPPPPSAAKPTYKSGWAPARPEPTYEYRISVTRTEYGMAFITATDEDEATDAVSGSDITWDDSSDIHWDSMDIERVSDEPTNQDDIDEWEEQYGEKYDTDGEPKCSQCQDCFPVDQLIADPDDDNAWHCDACASDHP